MPVIKFPEKMLESDRTRFVVAMKARDQVIALDKNGELYREARVEGVDLPMVFEHIEPSHPEYLQIRADVAERMFPDHGYDSRIAALKRLFEVLKETQGLEE